MSTRALPGSEGATPDIIAQSGEALRVSADELRRADGAALDELVAAMRQLTADAGVVKALVQSAGLSEPVVRLGLTTSFETFTRERLVGLRAQATGWPQNRTRLAAVVLAGNVFTAAARALLVPLVLGVPVVAKASSRESVFPRALAAALPEPFRGALDVHVFPGGDAACERALFARADVAHAYGADATLVELRRHVPATALFVPHGHGLGVAYVDGFTQADVEGLAMDVAAYDQRGCLSPLEVLVKGEAAQAERFAEALHDALSRLETRLPRGALGPGKAAAVAQWKGVAVATGRLFEGSTHAVAVETGARLPPVPGARGLIVAATSGREQASRRWEPYGASLKALGASRGCLREDAFPSPLGSAPSVCALGEMQRPPFDAMADGRPPHFGLVWREDV